jgi:group I intron endonuclease
MQGIYRIYCKANSKTYVGSSVCIASRWRVHRSRLNSGIHGNLYLQNAWNKYKAEAFDWVVLEIVESVTNLTIREQHWIDHTESKFNIRETAGSNLGFHHSAETRAKISAALKGKPSPGGNGRTGTKHTPETKAKLRATNIGKKHTPETKAKMSAAQKGRKLSPEHKFNLQMAARAANIGRKLSPEHIAKLRGRTRSPEHKAKLRAANIGRTRSPETKQKITMALIERHKKRREQVLEINS